VSETAPPRLYGDWLRAVRPGLSDDDVNRNWLGAAPSGRKFWTGVAARADELAKLREQLHALAAKWDATADRNQRNGQSLVDQGDAYGDEGLAIAEALDACVVDLRALLARTAQTPGAPSAGQQETNQEGNQ
jgi:hypothetical protein